MPSDNSYAIKRNILEMKASQKNRYAQLVEAQTPEPHELPELPKTSVTQGLHSSNQDEISSQSSEIPSVVTENKTATYSDSPSQLVMMGRKGSQCDSQMSTSFVSTASSRRVSVPSVEGTQLNMPESKISFHRSISRSMLDLDASSVLSDFVISWSNLTYSYKPSFISSFTKKPNLVLNDLSGHFKSNQLVAVIGPSGCGKTTLLHFLAGNIPAQRDKLRIRGLDEPKVALIGQDDCLLPGLTARETLLYASLLQNCRQKNKGVQFNHHEHVEMILDQLGLAECADRSVTKLSGGQLKRVTIGQELLYPTNLLVLDEVTSGLDASTSYSIVRLLKKLVSDNRYPMSIVMSIHQPSAKLFSVFDKVYVMSQGCCIYDGSCQIETVNAHLQRFGLECPKFHNIADHLLEIVCADQDSDRHIREQMIMFQRKHASEFSYTEGSLMGNTGLDGASISQREDAESQSTQMLGSRSASLYDSIEIARRRKKRPIVEHSSIHLRRSLLRISRSSILTYLQLMTYVILGLQLATFYGTEVGKLSGCPRLPMSFLALSLSEDSDDNLSSEMRRIQENMNFLLVAVMTSTFAALEITVITFPMEAKTIKREWRNGWYRVSSYFLGRTFADLPFQLSFVVVFCIIIYTLTGQLGFLTWRFATFVSIIIMTALVAQAVGFIFGALFMDNLPAAVFTAPLCIFPALLFSGFFSRVAQIPPFYKPMTYLSHFRYAFDALLVTLYGYNRCNCDQETLTGYHASMENQTISVRDMFRSLFGSNECATSSPSVDENSIEDVTATQNSLIAALSTTNGPPSSLPMAAALTASSTMHPKHLRSFEDLLVDQVFEHMNSTVPTVSTSQQQTGNVMDVMVDKFSNRITSMLNKQANYGHEVPKSCRDFNSYLVSEFGLHDDDLIFALAILLVFVLASRLISQAILSLTIASRTR